MRMCSWELVNSACVRVSVWVVMGVCVYLDGCVYLDVYACASGYLSVYVLVEFLVFACVCL